jgi:hypothetical protein
MRKLNVSLKSKEILSVNRIKLDNERLVYVLIANKKYAYRYRKSSIAYIGTTKKGLTRIAGSAAAHAENILGHGVTNVAARVITCKPRRRVKTWRKLERALILEFRAMHGDIPRQNIHGKNFKAIDEFEYFNQNAIRNIIEKLG